MRIRSHALIFILLVSSCYYDDIPRKVICNSSDLDLTVLPENESGCGNQDGKIVAQATGGSGTYKYSINGGKNKQSSDTFQNLSGGTYTVVVYDGTGCSFSQEVLIGIDGTNFNASVKTTLPDTGCLTDNGSVELQAAGGTGPYSFTLGSTTNSTGIFSGLHDGTYNVTASDGTCELNVSVTIPSEIATSFKNDIQPILEQRCNFGNCHGSGASHTNFTNYTNVKSKASSIKTKTGDGSMPKSPKPGGDIKPDEIKLIACWVDAGAPNN